MLLPLFRLFAALPLPVAHAIGRFAGRAIYALPGKYRRRLQANAAQAGYPRPRPPEPFSRSRRPVSFRIHER
ncbi:hypothetical protein BMR85_022120 [Achromobacter sp. KAs 3-5]|nr:hypothetical protein BMR85_022120 [Achromobacter sp. KAs 3-5]